MRLSLKQNTAYDFKRVKLEGFIWITTNMSGKMKNILSINSNPLTNPFCIERAKTNTICAFCYSQRMLKGLRKMCVPNFQYNSELLSSSILPESILPIFNEEIFRFNAHGELVNDNHYINLCHVSLKNPDTTFGLWTKRHDIILRFPDLRPRNMIYNYSNPIVDDPDPQVPVGFHRVFSVYKKIMVNKKINCYGWRAGGCDKCRKCYSKKGTKFINEKIK